MTPKLEHNGGAGSQVRLVPCCRQQPAPMMYKIPQGAMVMLRISRHAIYDQIHRGRLRIVEEGRATFVTAAAVRAYVELLEREAGAGVR